MTRSTVGFSRRCSFLHVAFTVLLLLPNLLHAAADEPKADGPESQAVLDRLGERIDFDFKEKTPLWDVINYMRVASQGPNDNGFRFDFDDDGLKKAEKTRHSPIPAALEGKSVPIKAALKKVLEPMGLTYSVEKGVLMIKASDPKDTKSS